MPSPQKVFAYIGNWNRNKPNNGIGICRHDVQSGRLELIKTVFEHIAVGAACLDARRRILYVNHEHTDLPGNYLGGGGLLYALAIDPETGDLREINHQFSYGSLPSYVAVDASGKYLIATHHTDKPPVTKVVKDAAGKYQIKLEYDDATTVLFRLEANGAIGDPCDVYIHTGDGGPLPIQTHPNMHSVMISPSGQLFALCDKGCDRVYMMRINRQTEKLEVCEGGVHESIPGSSPRYCVFHPTRPYLFVNHESKAVVVTYRYDEQGRLEPVCTLNVLPDGCEDSHKILQSDIQIHPGGRHLYTLIRGIESASVLEVNESDGTLRRIQTVKLEGARPRGCAIAPDGRFMHVAAHTGELVETWAIGDDGKLSPTGNRVTQPYPGNVTFFSA